MSDIAIKDLKTAFDQNGYAMLGPVLSAARVKALNTLIDQILEEEGQPNALNVFNAVDRYPLIAALVEEPQALRAIVNLLGYNLQLHVSNITVRRPIGPAGERAAFAGDKLPKERRAAGLNWHRDGPSPQFPRVEAFSGKICYVLSDLSEPDRGNTKVIPGSHKWPDFKPAHADSNLPVEGEVQICAAPGDAYIFTQNLWHSAAFNRSNIERRLIFIGYGACWTRPLDYEKASPRLLEHASPVLRQLLGEVGPTPLHHYMPDSMPLKQFWKGGPVVESVYA